ncbi:hypothetical protein MUP06_00975 [Patescibacteria group bacterium]|nr:hypothetical protein [Patescibacteria group bacterium]
MKQARVGFYSQKGQLASLISAFKDHPLREGILFILAVLIGLLLAFSAFATYDDYILIDDFETYDLKDIEGQGGWHAEGGKFIVQNSTFYEGEQALQFDSSNAGAGYSASYIDWHFSQTGSSTFYIRTDDTANAVGITYLWTEYHDYCTGILLKTGKIQYLATGAVWITLKETLPDTWYQVSIQWDKINHGTNMKFSVEGGTSTDWTGVAQTFEYLTGFDLYARIDNVSNKKIFWDYFDKEPFTPIVCGDYGDSWTCEQHGCCWYYNPRLFPNFCSTCPTGECGADVNSCPNCLTEEDCEEQSFCYWYEGVEGSFCKFGLGVCAYTIVDLQFCITQEACEGVGGYWYGNFCWISEQTAPTLDWSVYYEEYGEYETPLSWITRVAEKAQDFFENLGGILAVFINRFDLQEARTQGENLGAVIPFARASLSIFDDFFGNFPIGDLFLVVIVFVLAVGVFRIVRGLISLKFW